MRKIVVLGVLLGTAGASFAPTALAAGTGMAPSPALSAASGTALKVSVPGRATVRQQFQIRVKLTKPVSIAAFESAVLSSNQALEVVAGIPGNGEGRMIDPAISSSASRVGFYGGTPSGTRSDLIDILVSPKRPGLIHIRLALPLGVDGTGKVVPLHYGRTDFTVQVGTSKHVWRPSVAAENVTLHPSSKLHYDVSHDGQLTRADLYQAVDAWDSTAANTRSGGKLGRTGDVDGDGFTTVRDLELLALKAPAVPALPASGHALSAVRPAFNATMTWVVNTTDDLPDATPGDRICRTTVGTCSLRAAIDEANRRKGDDLIQFNIPGGAPQTIQLTSTLTQINATAGGLMIDGYSEPGAHANTDPLISNALPGVTINAGWSGWTTKSVSLMITSPNNVVQGLAFNNAGRGIHLYGPSSQNNYIVGDFFGMNASGQFSSNSSGYAGIDIDGASHNFVGTPALADRNDIVGFFYGIDHVSPGTTYNTEQNNLIGIGPDGNTVRGAGCDDVDHNTGPQHNQLGGLGDHERNVIVAGGCDGVEYSHGWNQALAPRADTSIQYQVNDNTIQGNYIGFAPDGHFEYRFIAAQGRYDEQDGSGVNVIDVSNGNLVEGNWIATHVNGVDIFGYQTQNNIVRGNHIGISPLGTPAYIGYSGVSVRWHAANNQIIGNDIHNTGQRTDQNGPSGGSQVNGCIDNTSNVVKGCSAGIRVNEDDDIGVLISQNTFDNIGNGIAIDLAPLGSINPNDPGDADYGPNNLLNFPVITGATTASVSGTVCANCTVEVSRTTSLPGVNGLPTQYLGTATANATGNWTLPVGLSIGDVVTSIAIDATSDTSEQSVDVAATAAPADGAPEASDSFSRAIAGGWGAADLGGSWVTIGSAADFAVNTSQATVNLAAAQTREARLGFVAQADVSVAATFALDRVPVGGNAFAYLTARTAGNVSASASYRGQIRIGANGLVYAQIRRFSGGVETAISSEVVVPGIAYTAGMPLRARLNAVGSNPTTLSLRVWDASQPEPASWNATATDSDALLQGPGGIGLRGYAGGPVTNGPISLSWDDLDVRVPTP